jgi:peptide/nickel transport system substrate-binding protein
MKMKFTAPSALLPLLVAAAISTVVTPALAAVPKDMLVIGKAADPQTLDPAVTIDNNDWTVTYPAYQRLIKYKTENGKGSTDVEGDLAESWQSAENGTVWTFRLHSGAAFADGTAVTAEALSFHLSA